VSSIHPDFQAKLEKGLGLKARRVQELIAAKAAKLHLSRHQAAVALAHDNQINVSRWETPEDLAAIRGAIAAYPVDIRPVRIPALPEQSSGRKGRVSTTTRKGGRDARNANAEPSRIKSVFVVHGRNEALRRDLFSFLRAVGLEPIEWQEAIELTGVGSPYVGQILDAAFARAVAVVVLFTPDDEARLKREFLQDRDKADERNLTGQARPNVLLEAGMALGRNANSTVLVQVGEMRGISDIAGRHIVHLTNDVASRQQLLVKLANAGANVDAENKTDWHTEGNFDIARRRGQRRSRTKKKSAKKQS
jgi:predicted nucleotide-binding protein